MYPSPVVAHFGSKPLIVDQPPEGTNHGHVKAICGADDDLDGDAAGDPALLEGDDSEQDVESKALLMELQKLVAAAGGLASA